MGADLSGFIHYWKVLGYLHGIKDEFNPFRSVSINFRGTRLMFHTVCSIVNLRLETSESDDLVSTRATIFEVTVSCWIPNLQSPPPMFHKMSQVQGSGF